MITVHHLEHSRSQRVLWLLEELGLPYEVKRYARDRKTMLAPPELRRIHPLGKSPVIVDGDVTVAETGAIVEYLVEGPGAGRLQPAAGTRERLAWRYWLHFAEGSAMPPLLMALVFGQIRQKAPWLVKPVAHAIADQVMKGFVQPNLDAQFAYVEQTLAAAPHFAGEAFSAADVMMSFPVEAAVQRAGLDAARHPATHAWLARMHARPAYARALERGGPFRIL